MTSWNIIFIIRKIFIWKISIKIYGIIFSFEKINALKEANSNGFIKNGNFRFNFQIIQLKEDNNIPIELEVGFEIKYINYQDMNLIIDEHLINKENIGFKIGSLYDSLIMNKHFIVFKNRLYIFYVYRWNRIKILEKKYFSIGFIQKYILFSFIELIFSNNKKLSFRTIY